MSGMIQNHPLDKRHRRQTLIAAKFFPPSLLPSASSGKARAIEGVVWHPPPSLSLSYGGGTTSLSFLDKGHPLLTQNIVWSRYKAWWVITDDTSSWWCGSIWWTSTPKGSGSCPAVVAKVWRLVGEASCNGHWNGDPEQVVSVMTCGSILFHGGGDSGAWYCSVWWRRASRWQFECPIGAL